MRKLFFSILAVLILAAAVLAQTASVEVKNKEGLGKFLVDAKGMTLYYFKKDAPNKSACAGPCVDKWPLFYVENITVPAGLNAKDFGTIIRDDGKKQTTYKGMPLYYFVNDKKAGDTTGQGVNNVWYVVAP